MSIVSTILSTLYTMYATNIHIGHNTISFLFLPPDEPAEWKPARQRRKAKLKRKLSTFKFVEIV